LVCFTALADKNRPFHTKQGVPQNEPSQAQSSLRFFFEFIEADLPYKEGELLIRFAPKAGGVQATIAEEEAIFCAKAGIRRKAGHKKTCFLTDF